MGTETTVAVPMTGTCANGHPVAVSLSIGVPAGTHGVHTATAACGRCGASVALSGTF